MKLQVGRTGRILYCIDMFLIKVAILLQLLRIFVPLNKRNAMFWICHVLIWLNFCFYTVNVFIAIFLCNPVKKNWSSLLSSSNIRNCSKVNKFYLIGNAINAASDVSIVILPQPVIWHLQISLKKKIGLGVIFLIGLL